MDRRWIGDSSFLASLGALSLARLTWLLPLADDWWWRHRARLMVVVVASVVCATLAIGEAIRLAVTRPSPPGDESGTSDQHGQLDSSTS